MMSRLWLMLVTLPMTGFVLPLSAYGWEVRYDASDGVLPSSASPPWSRIGGSGVQPTVADGVLHIDDASSTDYAFYEIEPWAIEAGVPVTMEARMRVVSDSDPLNRHWTTVMSIQTRDAYTLLSIHPDHLRAYEYGSGELAYGTDFASYRTIRLALDPSNRVYAWVDGQLAFSFSVPHSGGQGGVLFGAGSPEGMSDSYWQYVAYSKQFLPIPEPSSLLALAGGLVGLPGFALRRRARPGSPS